MSLLTSFPNKETTGLIKAPHGQLEVLITPTTDIELKQTIAIICYPHPLHGGTMHNKVVSTLARTCRDLGIASVRFNYRGVGLSSGNYANAVGEARDLQTIIAWLGETVPGYTLWLAGFSFGAYVAASVANTMDTCQQLISIAPAVNHADFTVLNTISCPWLIVQGEQDEIVPAQQVLAWARTIPQAPQVIAIPTASHFFHGKLVVLRDILRNALSDKPYGSS